MNVKDLYHIYQIGKHEKRKKLEILENISESSKEKDLIEAIEQAVILDDEYIAKARFNTDPHDKYYRKLRLKLKNRLLNSLLFLDRDDERFPALEAMEFKCEKMLLQAKVLYKEDALSPAEKLLKDILKQSEPLQIHHISFEVCRILSNLYARQADLKRYEEYDQKAGELKELLENEYQVVRVFKFVQTFFRYSVDKREELLANADAIRERLEKYCQAGISLKIEILCLRVKMTFCLLKGEFQEALRLCDEKFPEYKEAFINGKIDKLGALVIFKLNSLLALDRIDEGNNFCLVHMELFREYRETSFRFIELFFVFTLNLADVERARRFCDSMLGPHYVYLLDERAVERWKIYRGFTRFSEICLLKKPRKDLLLNEEVNSLSVYLKDKKGFNFYIQLLICLQQLLKKEEDLFVAKIESLKVYVSRYMKSNKRARLFIRLLNGLWRENFDPAACRTNLKRLVEQLKTTPVEGLIHGEPEVIRYERMWEMILNFLEKEKE